MTRKSKNTARYSEKEIKKLREEGKSATDWDKINSMTREEARVVRKGDKDAALSPSVEDWDDLIVSVTPPKEPLYMRVDADVLAWYREQGRGYQSTMNAVLRSYMQSHQDRV